MATEYRVLFICSGPREKALSEMLADRKLNLAAVRSGREALQICKQFVPDLVILDTSISDMAAVECCRSFKTTSGVAPIPLLAIVETQEQEVLMHNERANAVLVHSASGETLRTKTFELVQAKGSAARSRSPKPRGPWSRRPGVLLAIVMGLALLLVGSVLLRPVLQTSIPPDLQITFKTPIPADHIKGRGDRLWIYLGPTWTTLDKDRRRVLAQQVYEEAKGLQYRSLTLLGPGGETIARAKGGGTLHLSW